ALAIHPPLMEVAGFAFSYVLPRFLWELIVVYTLTKPSEHSQPTNEVKISAVRQAAAKAVKDFWEKNCYYGLEGFINQLTLVEVVGTANVEAKFQNLDTKEAINNEKDRLIKLIELAKIKEVVKEEIYDAWLGKCGEYGPKQ
ncbi:24469_t:CDS:2, partial [Racocetra persica]